MESTRRLFEVANYGLRNARRAAAALYWVVPQVPFWGSTSIMSEALEQLRERVVRTNEDLAVREDVETVALTTGRAERWVREAFSREHCADAKVFPGGFEMLLVPGAFVAATVHAPIGPSSGLPVPLGFASFNKGVLERAGKLLEANAGSFKLSEKLVRSLVSSLAPYDDDKSEVPAEAGIPEGS
jgi:hypothetical protein